MHRYCSSSSLSSSLLCLPFLVLTRLFICISQHLFRPYIYRIDNRCLSRNNYPSFLYINREKKICIAVLRFVLQIMRTDCMDYNNIIY
jgi:hypothetical protein